MARARDLLRNSALALAGFGAALVLWQLGVTSLEQETPIAASFAPLEAFRALFQLLQGDYIWRDLGLSLRRVAYGLAAAVAIGVPLGVLVGSSRRVAAALMPPASRLPWYRWRCMRSACRWPCRA